ncbi:TPA: tail fiber assembly protein [Escherichia coli]|nr:tail fiber assembly protein [Escherichia coli]EIT7712936.1 tail fiber assembly protein [Escherichia coli]EJA0980439.1 tail fiber assembly protein [Escherichia coli]EJD3859468.1 tail fiber assembly protein [Escherichia coli]EKG1468756.1 tail fiber assembly protein [Escherichia coli]
MDVSGRSGEETRVFVRGSQQTEQRKATLLSEADTIIRLLERSVRLNMATEEERTRLSAWERYSVLLSRVDSANPEWPQKPEQ